MTEIHALHWLQGAATIAASLATSKVHRHAGLVYGDEFQAVATAYFPEILIPNFHLNELTKHTQRDEGRHLCGH